MSTNNMLLGNRYEIGRLLGRGGMAEVYLAVDKRLNRTVAVKVLRSDLAQDEHFQERFRREAQAAASLNHPSIVGVHDTGEDHRTENTGEEVTIPYIVMEYVEGETLRGSISEEHPIGEQRAASIMSGVLGALEYSHRAGIVHRDIKPGNVMITSHGEVKVMDFGIARAIAEATSAMTQTQAVMGTAQYLSPEQARGQQVDARSDVYSAAVVLYELLTGRPPFTGDSPVSIAYQHVRESAPTPSTFNPNVTRAMDAVVLKGLAKDRDQRYQSAAEFSRDIQAAAHGRQPSALAAGAAGAAGVAAGAAGSEAATAMMSPQDYPTEQMQEQNTQLIPTHTAPLAPAAAAAPVATAQGQDVQKDDDERDRGKILVWVLALLAVAAVIAAAAWFFIGQNSGPEQVSVPNVVGQSEAQARTQLTDAGLKPSFKQEANPDVQAGEVVSTDPAAGASVNEGAAVSVVVSSGPGSVDVPDLKGMTEDEAKDALDDLGLTLVVEGTEDIDGFSADTIGRTEPEAGSTLAEGDEVKAWLASGKVTVPKLVGLNEQAAIDQIESIDDADGNDAFEYEVSYKVDEAQPVGSVLEQSPAEGEKVEPGTKIDIIVNKEPGPVAVPNVTGQPRADAEKALADAGFGITVKEEFSDTVDKGRVIKTDPAANAQVEKGTTITIIVSKGPDTTTTTPTPSTTTPDPTTPSDTTPSPTPSSPSDTTTKNEGTKSNGKANAPGQTQKAKSNPGAKGKGNN